MPGNRRLVADRGSYSESCAAQVAADATENAKAATGRNHSTPVRMDVQITTTERKLPARSQRLLVEPETDALDGAGAEASGGVARAMIVSFDEYGVHLHIARGYVEAGGHAVEKFADDALAVHAEDAAVRAGHADIGDVGGALGQDAFVGGGDVRVRANDGGDAPVEVIAHRYLFAGRLGVHVHQDERDIRRQFAELAIRFAERVIDGAQKHAALQIEHGVFHAVFRGAGEDAAAGIALGKIRRAQQARLLRNVVQDFAAVPTVVSAGEDIDSGAKELFGETRRDAEARGGVFAVGDDKIGLALRDNVGEAVANDLTPGRAPAVAVKKNAPKKVNRFQRCR